MAQVAAFGLFDPLAAEAKAGVVGVYAVFAQFGAEVPALLVQWGVLGTHDAQSRSHLKTPQTVVSSFTLPCSLMNFLTVHPHRLTALLFDSTRASFLGMCVPYACQHAVAAAAWLGRMILEWRAGNHQSPRSSCERK